MPEALAASHWRRPALQPEIGNRLSPHAVSKDSSALFLYTGDSDGGGRYRTITRLGNALRKRVKFVPAAFIAPYLEEVSVAPVGEIAPDYAVFRARLPGLDETFLLAAMRGSPVAAKLAGAAHAATAERKERARGLARAREIAAYAAGWDGYVAILPGGSDPAQLYLPFLLRSTEVYLPLPGGEEELAARLYRAPVLGLRRFGGAAARRVEFLGRRATVVEFR
jgi:hypothetical protein